VATPLRADDRFARIIVICTRQIGDVLLTTPLIAAAKARWPQATIDVLGFGGTLGMLRGNPDVAALIEVPAGSGWVASRRLIARLWRRYDLALIAQYSDRAHLYGFAAAKRRAGQVTDEPKSWWKRALLEHKVRMNEAQSHSVVEKLRLLAPWVEPAGARLVAPQALPLPAEVAAALVAPYAVLQAPAAVTYKLWPLAHWRVLVAALVARGLQVVLTGAASAGDRTLVATVREGLASERVLDVCGRLHLDHPSRGGVRGPGRRPLRADQPALFRALARQPHPRGSVPEARARAARRPGRRAAGNAGLRAVRPRRLRGPQRQPERVPADAGAGARRRRGRAGDRGAALTDNEAMNAGKAIHPAVWKGGSA
jgi:ADP-heptose:LPS heptosyltransferase